MSKEMPSPEDFYPYITVVVHKQRADAHVDKDAFSDRFGDDVHEQYVIWAASVIVVSDYNYDEMSDDEIAEIEADIAVTSQIKSDAELEFIRLTGFSPQIVQDAVQIKRSEKQSEISDRS